MTTAKQTIYYDNGGSQTLIYDSTDSTNTAKLVALKDSTTGVSSGENAQKVYWVDSDKNVYLIWEKPTVVNNKLYYGIASRNEINELLGL